MNKILDISVLIYKLVCVINKFALFLSIHNSFGQFCWSSLLPLFVLRQAALREGVTQNLLGGAGAEHDQ